MVANASLIVPAARTGDCGAGEPFAAEIATLCGSFGGVRSLSAFGSGPRRANRDWHMACVKSRQ